MPRNPDFQQHCPSCPSNQTRAGLLFKLTIWGSHGKGDLQLWSTWCWPHQPRATAMKHMELPEQFQRQVVITHSEIFTKADAAEAASWIIGSSMTASTTWNPILKKNTCYQFTFSLVPGVRPFGSGRTEAAISEKGNDGKFNAVFDHFLCVMDQFWRRRP